MPRRGGAAAIAILRPEMRPGRVADIPFRAGPRPALVVARVAVVPALLHPLPQVLVKLGGYLFVATAELGEALEWPTHDVLPVSAFGQHPRDALAVPRERPLDPLPHLLLRPAPGVLLHGPRLLDVLSHLERHLRPLELLQGPDGGYGVLRVGRRGAHRADRDDERALAGEGVRQNPREEALAVRGLLPALRRPHHAEALLQGEDRGVDLRRVLAALQVVLRAVLPPLAARAVDECQHRTRRAPAGAGACEAVDGVRPRGRVIDLGRTRGAACLCAPHQGQELIGGMHVEGPGAEHMRAVLLVLHDFELLHGSVVGQQVPHVLAGDLKSRKGEGGRTCGPAAEELGGRPAEQAVHGVRLPAARLAEHEKRRDAPLLQVLHRGRRALEVDLVVVGGLAEGVREAEPHV
mmetsp:Transcript_57842/g.163248  ORF Transcript_57842/g.163248 Transcript_57842/m.163248 type:complete len:407 (-) Transcript_57842:817-2037(-)